MPLRTVIVAAVSTVAQTNEAELLQKYRSITVEEMKGLLLDISRSAANGE